MNQEQSFWRVRVEINISMIDVLAIHGLIGLALKHPQVGDAMRHNAALLSDKFAAILLDSGAVTQADLEGRGD